MMLKKRVLILNDYSVEIVTVEIKNGLKPNHHLYGILELQNEGHELIVIDPDDNKFWRRLSKLVDKIPFSKMGNLRQQIKAFKRRREYDIVYAPCQNVTQLLGLLSYLKIFNKKIIAIAHHPIIMGRASWLRRYGFYITLKGHYKWGALSSVVAEQINTITRSEMAECFHWGPALDFYDKISKEINDIPLRGKSVDIISIGRTKRDYKVLINAFNNTEIQVEIYCPKEFVENLGADYTNNIKVFELDEHESLKYPELIKLYKNAKIMAIPLGGIHKTLIGLTSITDALALGMPIIMTKNNFVEIDIEKEGIGYWVDPQESEQWRLKVAQILNTQNLEKFSANARKLAENSYNTDIFLRELLEASKNA
jgi:glycosyltransferase involved in cell wall biosynthesis